MNTPNTDSFNPYAAPTADTSFTPDARVGQSEAGSYYAMSVTKLWVMTVLTMGLYNVVFFYNHWKHLRDHHAQDVSPIGRAIFGAFTYFGLNSQIGDAARFRNIPTVGIFGAAPILFFASSAAGRVLDRVAGDELWVVLLNFVLVPIFAYCLASTQTTVNNLLRDEGYAGPVNDGATAGAVIFGVLGALVWGTSLLGVATML